MAENAISFEHYEQHYENDARMAWVTIALSGVAAMVSTWLLIWAVLVA